MSKTDEEFNPAVEGFMRQGKQTCHYIPQTSRSSGFQKGAGLATGSSIGGEGAGSQLRQQACKVKSDSSSMRKPGPTEEGAAGLGREFKAHPLLEEGSLVDSEICSEGPEKSRSLEVSPQVSPVRQKLSVESQSAEEREFFVEERQKVVLDTEELNLAEAFQNIDRDRDGLICISDIMREIKNSNPKLTANRLLTFSEFLSNVLPHYSSHEHKEKWRLEDFVTFMHDAAFLEKSKTVKSK